MREPMLVFMEEASQVHLPHQSLSMWPVGLAALQRSHAIPARLHDVKVLIPPCLWLRHQLRIVLLAGLSAGLLTEPLHAKGWIHYPWKEILKRNLS